MRVKMSLAQEETAAQTAAAGQTLASTVLVAITPRLDGVEAPLLAVERERCPNCGNYHATPYARYIQAERSIFLTGWLISTNTVVCRDMLINPKNIAAITVSRDGETVHAVLEGVFAGQQAMES